MHVYRTYDLLVLVSGGSRVTRSGLALEKAIPDSLTREEGSVDEVVKQLSQRLPPGSPEFLYLGKYSSF